VFLESCLDELELVEAMKKVSVCSIQIRLAVSLQRTKLILLNTLAKRIKHILRQIQDEIASFLAMELEQWILITVKYVGKPSDKA
jgi:hypothetical protein